MEQSNLVKARLHDAHVPDVKHVWGTCYENETVALAFALCRNPPSRPPTFVLNREARQRELLPSSCAARAGLSTHESLLLPPHCPKGMAAALAPPLAVEGLVWR